MTVSTRLMLTSKIFPWLVFSGFPHSSKTSTLYSSCHLLKPFLFHILHVIQSRVSMGLTGSCISVKKLAVRRKYCQIWTLSCRKKIDLKNISLLQCVVLCYSGLTVAEKWPQLQQLAVKSSPRSAILSLNESFGFL